MKPCGAKAFGSLSAFGHDGAAGAMVFADPVGEIVLGYAVRRFTYPGGMDPRIRPVIKAIQNIARAE
jgi:CubicO group peptidase (beta-lactamase class C family)